MSTFDQQRIIEAATRARDYAQALYSNFQVGAALEAEDGCIFTGCNIESSTYGLTVCAERVAIWKALSEGKRRFKRIAVVADTEQLTPPCGACLQIMWDFCGNIPVVLANLQGDTETLPLRDLYPRPFDAHFLSSEAATVEKD